MAFKNNSFDKAQEISLNTTVNGHHPAYSVRDYDFYKIDLKAGQRITVEQWAACFPFGGGNDGVLTFYGPDKKEILRVASYSCNQMVSCSTFTR